MKQSVYIETTIVSYLTAKPSLDVLKLAKQQVTREWWSKQRVNFDLFTSQFVLDEAGDGDRNAARERLIALSGIPMIPSSDEAEDLAKNLVKHGLLPPKAAIDATHLAVAAVSRLDVLLTWNCTHLANVPLLVQVGRFLRKIGYESPIVCTPYELLGEQEEASE